MYDTWAFMFNKHIFYNARNDVYNDHINILIYNYNGKDGDCYYNNNDNYYLLLLLLFSQFLIYHVFLMLLYMFGFFFALRIIVSL